MEFNFSFSSRRSEIHFYSIFFLVIPRLLVCGASLRDVMCIVMEDLEEKLKGLEMTEDEEQIIDCIEEEDETMSEQLRLCLVGTLLTTNPFRVETMKNTLKIAWLLGKGMVVREIEHNLFIFQFFSAANKMKVLEEGPWSFVGAPLLLKEVEDGIQHLKLNLTLYVFGLKLKMPLLINELNQWMYLWRLVRGVCGI